MNSNYDRPKVFIDLCGKPLLIHTLEAFSGYSPSLEIVLVLSEQSWSWWERLSTQNPISNPITLEAGGPTRFCSVRNGLSHVSGPGLVAIHDGARPLVHLKVIADAFAGAALYGAAAPAVRLKDSLRAVDSVGSNTACDRSTYRIVQTPQAFSIDLIKEAYAAYEGDEATDDASVVERAGYAIHLVEGSYSNIKVTTSEDITMAEALLRGEDRNNPRPELAL